MTVRELKELLEEYDDDLVLFNAEFYQISGIEEYKESNGKTTFILD